MMIVGQRLLILLILVFMLVTVQLFAQTTPTYHWADGASPILGYGQKIYVGRGAYMSSGATITMIQGDTVQLSAGSFDSDDITRTCPTPEITSCYEDVPYIKWSVSGGQVSSTRVVSEQLIDFTAPTLSASETSRVVTVTYQADDDTTSGNGTPYNTTTDTGEHEDAPGECGTLNIKIIKSGPTSVTCETHETPADYDDFWEAGYRTHGYKIFKCKVSGGTPPNPPDNWNGFFVKETMEFNSIDVGDLTNSHLDYVNVDVFRVATSQGFIVGQEGINFFDESVLPATDDIFYDTISRFGPSPVLKDGVTPKNIKILHKYYSNSTLLGSFVRIHTLSNTTFDPDGSGSVPSYRVTKDVID